MLKRVALVIPEASKGAKAATEHGLEVSHLVKTLRLQARPNLVEISEGVFGLRPSTAPVWMTLKAKSTLSPISESQYRRRSPQWRGCPFRRWLYLLLDQLPG